MLSVSQWYGARRMFGMGGTEILVILIVALLFLGPDKLPDAAKSISKGIRDLRKQTREFQETIENDERIGGAIRDIKSALNGEDPRPRIRPPRPLPAASQEPIAETAEVGAGMETGTEVGRTSEVGASTSSGPDAEPHAVTLPPTAGEKSSFSNDDKDLSAMIKPVEGAIPKGSANGHG
jgi:sec-independent protein translocase protein TatB